MFIRKAELAKAIEDYDRNKRWYVPSTYDDSPMTMLRKFVFEHLDGISSTEEIAYRDFLQFACDSGEFNLLNDDYLQSEAPSRYIFLTWRQNEELSKSPCETWHYMMNFLNKQSAKRLFSTCSYFQAYGNDEKLLERLPYAPRDYSQHPTVFPLPGIELVAPEVFGHYAFAMSYERPAFYKNADNVLHIIDLHTAKIVESHPTNLHRLNLRKLHFMANGNILFVSRGAFLRLLDPHTGNTVKNINQFFTLGDYYHYTDHIDVLAAENSIVFYPPKNNYVNPFYPVSADHPNELFVRNVDTGEGYYMPAMPEADKMSQFKIENGQCVYTDNDGDSLAIHLPDSRADAKLFHIQPLPTGDILYGYCLQNEERGHYVWKQFYIARFPELKLQLSREKSEPEKNHEEDIQTRCRMM